MNRRDNDILITENGFEPAEIHVEVGTEVNFINHDEKPHKIISEVELFESGEIAPGEMFSFVFDDPGTQNFYDPDNENETGRVVVD
jgi:plastocyanin